MSSLTYDAIQAPIPKPALREKTPRRVEAPPATEQSEFDASRDLAPARGVIAAVVFGSALWLSIAVGIRALLA
jgi:hypothetical protein